MSRRGSAVALGSLPATIVVSDPWELATPVGSPGLRVVLLRRQPADGGDKERVLGRLLDPLRWKDATVGHVVIEARRGDELLADLEAGSVVSCNVLGVADQVADGDAPWGADDWRGGVAFVGDVGLG